MFTKNPRRGAVLWVILLLVLVLAACVEVVYRDVVVTSTPGKSQATQVSQEVSQPQLALEEPADLSELVPCNNEPTLRQVELDDFGFAFSYPSNWYIQTYKPGEWVGTGDPGPEYIAALSNLPNNFDPGYSRGLGQYDQNTEVVQVFIWKGPKVDVPDRDPQNGSRIITNHGNKGYFEGYESNPTWEEPWITYTAALDAGNYGLYFDERVYWGSNRCIVNGAVWYSASSLLLQ